MLSFFAQGMEKPSSSLNLHKTKNFVLLDGKKVIAVQMDTLQFATELYTAYFVTREDKKVYQALESNSGPLATQMMSYISEPGNNNLQFISSGGNTIENAFYGFLRANQAKPFTKKPVRLENDDIIYGETRTSNNNVSHFIYTPSKIYVVNVYDPLQSMIKNCKLKEDGKKAVNLDAVKYFPLIMEAYDDFKKAISEN